MLLVLNFLGTFVYAWAASHGWVRPEEQEFVSGEPFIWFLFVFPVCVVFFVLNLTWGAFILYRKQWRIGIFWLVLIPIKNRAARTLVLILKLGGRVTETKKIRILIAEDDPSALQTVAMMLRATGYDVETATDV
jgi:hypothetical protein